MAVSTSICLYLYLHMCLYTIYIYKAHLSELVQQRPAGVSWVDCRIRLNEIHFPVRDSHLWHTGRVNEREASRE